MPHCLHLYLCDFILNWHPKAPAYFTFLVLIINWYVGGPHSAHCAAVFSGAVWSPSISSQHTGSEEIQDISSFSVCVCVCVCVWNIPVPTLLETKPFSLFLHSFCISHGKRPKTDTAITIWTNGSQGFMLSLRLLHNPLRHSQWAGRVRGALCIHPFKP